MADEDDDKALTVTNDALPESLERALELRVIEGVQKAQTAEEAKAWLDVRDQALRLDREKSTPWVLMRIVLMLSLVVAGMVLLFTTTSSTAGLFLIGCGLTTALPEAAKSILQSIRAPK